MNWAVLEYTGLDCLHWDLIGGVVTGHWSGSSDGPVIQVIQVVEVVQVVVVVRMISPDDMH